MASANLQMMRLSDSADIGVSTKDGEVFMAFDADGELIDVTMTREQAIELGNKLLRASNASSHRWTG